MEQLQIQRKKYFTEEEAKKKVCPFRCSEKDRWTKYEASGCMAWQVAFNRTEREDHSDANFYVSDYGMKTGRRPRREGPLGCMGHWILDEVGYCERIQKGEI